MSIQKEKEHKGFLDEIFEDGFWSGIATISLMGAIGLLGYQIYLWLQQGVWTNISMRWVMSRYEEPGIIKWLYADNSWLGFKKIIAWLLDVPLFLDCLILGIGIALVAGWIQSEFGNSN